jgi:hypothetical protein
VSQPRSSFVSTIVAYELAAANVLPLARFRPIENCRQPVYNLIVKEPFKCFAKCNELQLGTHGLAIYHFVSREVGEPFLWHLETLAREMASDGSYLRISHQARVHTGARQTCRALQKYMHEFNADRDHAMCNIQNRSIQAVQLTQLRKLSNKIFHGTGVLHSS